MTRVALPTRTLLLRLPAVRAALLAAVLAPVVVRWAGDAAGSPLRLRGVTLLLAAAAALAWDDRLGSLTAATPVGLPAIRRGRALVVLAVLALGYGASCLVVAGQGVPWAAVHLQAAGLALLVAAVVGRLTHAGEQPALALPVPVLLVVLVLLSRLPESLSLLRAQPGSAGWSGEVARWCAVMVVALAVVTWHDRDPAVRAVRWRGDACQAGPGMVE